VGLYCDGEPRHDLVVDLEPGASFDEADIPAVRRMWDEARAGGSDHFVWLGLREVGPGEVERAAELFGIDHHQIEDALSLEQRARVDIGLDRIFAVFKVLGYDEPTSAVETGQIAVWVGPSYVLSVRQGTPGDLSSLRSRLEASPDLLRVGPLAVMHGILDVVVDGYSDVLAELGRDIAELEERVFSPERTDDAMAIYELKRENLEMRRAVDPLLPVAEQLMRHELVSLPEVLRPHYRDLGDHLLRVSEVSAQYDVLLGTILDALRSRQAVQQNEDMRKISAWVAIAAVPTAIAGVYGMNFEFMPELSWSLGYPAVLLLMTTVCVLLYRGFKRNGWL
jgi:magnesium transporter